MIVAIVLVVQFTMQIFDSAHVDIGNRPGSAVAMVLAQMQRQMATRHLHIDGRVGSKAVLPVGLTTEKIEIELAGLGQREDAEYRHGASEFDRHLRSPGMLRPAGCAFLASAARRYDLMNDLMSGGLHRAWKDALVTAVNPPPSDKPFALLDLAGGTGD